MSTPTPPPIAAPALYTPDAHLFADADAGADTQQQHSYAALPDADFRHVYEIDSTVAQIRDKGYRRIALQFPDELLADSTRVYALISQGIAGGGGGGGGRKVFILADTPYSACCVDEIAAEHCAADVVVHYGRSCLSPTTRLPVLYVFTTRPLSVPLAAASFAATFPDRAAPVVLMADVTYSAHIPALHAALAAAGYTRLFATRIVHDPSAPLPNRTHPPPPALRAATLWHIAPPLPSLLLVLASRVAAVHTYAPNTAGATTAESTTLLLRRRYALVSRARSAAVVGILVNTLNVRNYLPMIARTKRAVAAAGRKPYLVVVGKVNVAKVANFDEVQAWVGIGCWEQGVVGSPGGREFYRPVVTPFELAVALDPQKAWGEEWVVDFEALLAQPVPAPPPEEEEEGSAEEDSGDEAPVFDLRTGRYVAAARAPRKKKAQKPQREEAAAAGALVRSADSAKQVLAGGVVSPAAEFLREKRTWRGLGSDFVVAYEQEEEEVQGAVVEAGRSGVARGYEAEGAGGERR